MKRIFKYSLANTSEVQKVLLPFGATVLNVGQQNGNIVFWAMVSIYEGYAEETPRYFRVAATGEDFELPDLARYIGYTGLNDWYVAHVMEVDHDVS